MPTSIARRAARSVARATALVFAAGFTAAILSLPVYADDPANGVAQMAPSGPPQQITASFSEQDNFIARLRSQGVSDDEARSIDKSIRAALTPAQRKSGALIELTFGGDGWPWTLQSIDIEPLHGQALRLDRATVAPSRQTAGVPAPAVKAPAASTAASTPAASIPATPAPAASTTATTKPSTPAPSPGPSTAPSIAAAKPVAANDGSIAAVNPGDPQLATVTVQPVAATSPATQTLALQPANIQLRKPAAPTVGDSKGQTPIDPFALDNSSSTKLLPQAGATDPEWPSQPPKPQTVKAGGQTLAVVHGKLNTDVRSSLLHAGVPERIAVEIAQAVSLHPPLRDVPLTGSRFDVAFQPTPDPTVGFILADFSVNGGHQRIWRYRPEGGVPGFYTDDGTRIGGLTMQSPVPGAPIVSPYGMRKHPVLHVNKMHWGVDYAANTGTPILAAADGTVEDVRRLGNYGLYIRVGHSDGVETTYGHLSRFEKGLKAGDPVKAGDVIGYAGSSGLASGPHLYFEVFVDGKRVNPVPLVSDEPLRLGAADLAIFEHLKRQTTAVQTASQDQ